MAIIRTVSSRELNQDVTRAKNAAKQGPVFITDRGTPTHALLSIEDYMRLTKQTRNIAHALAMPLDDEFEFDPPKINLTAQSVDLS